MQGVRFKTILVNPVWPVTGGQNRGVQKSKKLEAFTVEDLKALPVGRELSDWNSQCWLWVPTYLMRQGMEVLEDWGFTYRNCVTWVKLSKESKKFGVYFKNMTEDCLVGYRGNPELNDEEPEEFTEEVTEDMKGAYSGEERCLYGMRGNSAGEYASFRAREVNIIICRRPRQYLAKPVVFYDLAERCGRGPRISLFSREHREGWYHVPLSDTMRKIEYREAMMEVKRQATEEARNAGEY